MSRIYSGMFYTNNPEEMEKLARSVCRDLVALKTFADQQKAVQDELHDNSTINIKTVLSNFNSSSGAIAMSAGTKDEIKTTATMNYLIAGQWYTLGATDPFWDLTGFDVTDGYVNKCLLCIDAAGNDQIAPGTEALAAADVVLPAVPLAYAVCGMLQVTMAGAAFTGGTTLLDAGTVTAVYTNLAFHPDLLKVPGSAKATAVGTLQTHEG